MSKQPILLRAEIAQPIAIYQRRIQIRESQLLRISERAWRDHREEGVKMIDQACRKLPPGFYTIVQGAKHSLDFEIDENGGQRPVVLEKRDWSGQPAVIVIEFIPEMPEDSQ
jgi:hypothetical protein